MIKVVVQARRRRAVGTRLGTPRRTQSAEAHETKPAPVSRPPSAEGEEPRAWSLQVIQGQAGLSMATSIEVVFNVHVGI